MSVRSDLMSDPPLRAWQSSTYGGLLTAFDTNWQIREVRLLPLRTEEHHL